MGFAAGGVCLLAIFCGAGRSFLASGRGGRSSAMIPIDVFTASSFVEQTRRTAFTWTVVDPFDGRSSGESRDIETIRSLVPVVSGVSRGTVGDELRKHGLVFLPTMFETVFDNLLPRPDNLVKQSGPANFLNQALLLPSLQTRMRALTVKLGEVVLRDQEWGSPAVLLSKTDNKQLYGGVLDTIRSSGFRELLDFDDELAGYCRRLNPLLGPLLQERSRLGRKRADKNFSEWLQSSYTSLPHQF